jgi:8-oxo-dGTP pyrophosphatase MutT (NUDIX family)
MKVTCVDFYGNEHVVDAGELIDRMSAYGICIANNAVLLIKDPRSLRWELPGGGMEKGETPEQSLTREFIEETGAAPVGSVTFIKKWEEHFFDVVSQQAWHSKRMFYRVEAIDGRKKLLARGNGEDSTKAEFIPIEKLGTLHIAPSIRDLIDEQPR